MQTIMVSISNIFFMVRRKKFAMIKINEMKQNLFPLNIRYNWIMVR